MSIIIRGNSSIGGGSGGGSGIYIGGTDLSADATTVDEYAENDIISKSNSSSASTALFGVNIENIKLGTYAIMVRVKASAITSSNNLINLKATLNSESGETLGEVNIKGDMFETADKYQMFGFVVDLNDVKGSTIYLTASLPANSDSITVSVDYVLVSPAFCSISSVG